MLIATPHLCHPIVQLSTEILVCSKLIEVEQEWTSMFGVSIPIGAECKGTIKNETQLHLIKSQKNIWDVLSVFPLGPTIWSLTLSVDPELVRSLLKRWDGGLLQVTSLREPVFPLTKE